MKLTPEKTRERIDQLTAWQQLLGLTLREEEYLEGLQRMVAAEVRVVELEQQIEDAELQACADAAKDEYYDSLGE